MDILGFLTEEMKEYEEQMGIDFNEEDEEEEEEEEDEYEDDFIYKTKFKK